MRWSSFAGEFGTSEGGGIRVGQEAGADELDEDQRSEETIQRYVPPPAESGS